MEEQDLCGIAEFARKNPVHVRFIEMMPIGYGSSFAGMPQEKIMNLVEQKFGKMIHIMENLLEMGHVRIILLMDLREKLGLSAQSAINSVASVIVYGLRHRDI